MSKITPKTYTVQKYDGVNKVAKELGLSRDEVISLHSKDTSKMGQKDGHWYFNSGVTVSNNDVTTARIAQRWGKSIPTLATLGRTDVVEEPSQPPQPKLSQKYKVGQTVQVDLTKIDGVTVEGVRGEVAEFNPLTGKYKIRLYAQEAKGYQYSPAWHSEGCTQMRLSPRDYPAEMREITFSIQENTMIEVSVNKSSAHYAYYKENYNNRYSSPAQIRDAFVHFEMTSFSEKTADNLGEGLSTDQFSKDEQVVLQRGVTVQIDPGMLQENREIDLYSEDVRGRVLGRNPDGSYKVKIENGYQIINYNGDTARINEQTIDIPEDKLTKSDARKRDYLQDWYNMGDREWRRLGMGGVAFGATLPALIIPPAAIIPAAVGIYYTVPALTNLTIESAKIGAAYLYNEVNVVHNTVDALGKAKDGAIKAVEDTASQVASSVGNGLAKAKEVIGNSFEKKVSQPVSDSFRKLSDSFGQMGQSIKKTFSK